MFDFYVKLILRVFEIKRLWYGMLFYFYVLSVELIYVIIYQIYYEKWKVLVDNLVFGIDDL